MLWTVLLFISYVGATVVPEELPSLLSVVYSNVPPIKKGTDSRVGFGFALGPHADFQVLFELGPQQETQKSPMPFPHTVKKLSGRQAQKTQTKRKAVSGNTESNVKGNEFINSWSEQFKPKKSSKPYNPLPIPDDKDNTAEGTLDLKKIIQVMGLKDGQINQPKPSISSNALNKLKQLYGQKPDSELSSQSTTNKPRFVPKRNKPKPTASSAGLPSSFDRLKQFALDEEKVNDVKKRKITEDLSDVSLDDE